MKKLFPILTALVLFLCFRSVAGPITNNPVADSYVLRAFQTANFGTSIKVDVESDNTNTNVNRDGYLKFSVAGVNPVSTATLRLRAKVDTGANDLTVYTVADTNWTETGITWSNRPPLGTILIGNNVSGSGAWYDFDVSEYVRTNQSAGADLMTFGLHASNSATVLITVDSKETSNKPELIIVTNHPPTNFITQPSNSSTVSAPGITIAAQAGDSDGTITNVAFYAGSMLLANITSITNGSYLCTASIVGGLHTLKAIAYDNLGLSATSSVSVTVINVTDLNTNGVPDILEDVALSSPMPFANAPFIVTGAFEAEQFDAGGFGVAYENVVAHPTNAYRVTGMWITNCDDLGRGYELRLKSNELAIYTFKVQLAGRYVVSLRAKGASGGQCSLLFESANGQSIYPIDPPALSGTDWENLQVVVTLDEGFNKLQVMGKIEAGGLAAAINHISIYPHLAPLTFPTNTVTVGTGSYANWTEGEMGTNFLFAVTNSTTLQSAINDVISAGGGTVQIPAGKFYLAQNPAAMANAPTGWEFAGCTSFHNYAVGLPRNIRLAGTVDVTTGTNKTLLVAHNRAVTLIAAGWGFGSGTNIALENLTLKANPHIRTNGSFEPGWFINATWMATNQVFANCNGSPRTNEFALTATFGHSGASTPFVAISVHGLAIKHCDFINGPNNAMLINYSSGMSFLSNTIHMVNADFETNLTFARWRNTDGTLSNKEPWKPITAIDNYTWNNPTPGCGLYANACTNVVMMYNRYDGNPAQMPNTNGQLALSDGFLFATSGGGNWYLAENDIHRFGLEGIFFYNGPNAAVRNRFSTMEIANLSAFVLGEHHGVGVDAWDYTTSIVGNSFVCVRGAVSAYAGTSLNFSGNYVSNSLPIGLNEVPWCEANGTAVAMIEPFGYANICGNTTTNIGYGVSSYANYPGTGYFIVANDFSKLLRKDTSSAPGAGSQPQAPLRFEFGPDRTSFANVTIARNLIGSFADNPAHVSVKTADALQMYLLQNVYLNTNGYPTNLLLSPTDAPVHVY